MLIHIKNQVLKHHLCQYGLHSDSKKVPSLNPPDHCVEFAVQSHAFGLDIDYVSLTCYLSFNDDFRWVRDFLSPESSWNRPMKLISHLADDSFYRLAIWQLCGQGDLCPVRALKLGLEQAGLKLWHCITLATFFCHFHSKIKFPLSQVRWRWETKMRICFLINKSCNIFHMPVRSTTTLYVKKCQIHLVSGLRTHLSSSYVISRPKGESQREGRKKQEITIVWARSSLCLWLDATEITPNPSIIPSCFFIEL